MKRRLWINLALGLVIVLIIGGIVVAIRGTGGEQTSQRTVQVATQTVSATASATGTVVVPGAVALAFPSNGIVTSVDVADGDSVTKGQVLATIDDTAAKQALANAKSGLVQAQSNAANAGTNLSLTQQSVEVGNSALDASVAQAQENLAAAQASWSEACTNPDDPTCPNPAAAEAIRTAQSSVTGAQLAYDNTVQTAANAEITYNLAVNQASQNLASAKTYATDQCNANGDSSIACHNAQDAIVGKQQAYDSAVNNRTQSMMKDQQSVKTASMTLSNANVAMRKTIADLRKNHDDQVRTAKQALANAKTNRDKGKVANQQSLNSAKQSVAGVAGGVSTSQAAVAAAKAAVAVALETVANTRLVAPVDGEVGGVNLTVGEASTGSAASAGGITIIPAGGYQVEAAFAESDAAGIKVGQTATVTFQGLPGVTATGSVLSVDPVAQTGSTNNLVTFTVRVALDSMPDGLRQGMTATVAVTTTTAENVLAVPQSAITTIGNTSTVEVLQTDGTTTTVQVTTGVQGDSFTEITSGVKEGDTLVIPTASTSGFPTGGIPGGGGGSRVMGGGGPRG